jgi:NADH-quinone oxidoreductase subunit E
MADSMDEVRDEGAIRATTLPPGWDEPVDLEADPATIPDPAEVEVPDALRAEIERLMGLYPDRHSATLPALGAAQRVHGWCSDEAIQQVAAVMQVTPAYLSSVATFYDMLRTERPARAYVYVCTSVACHVRDARRLYDALQAEADAQGVSGELDLREFECLGACDMAPMASFDGRYVGPMSGEDAAEAIRQLTAGETVLPGRGLEDRGYAVPTPAPQPEGEPEHPKVDVAGGAWPEAADEEPPPATGPRPHPRDLTEPLAPGTSYAGEDVDPFTHDVIEPEREEEREAEEGEE